MISTRRVLYFMFALALTGGSVSAQVMTGVPPFGSLTGGPDVINLANLNVHQTFPVRHKAGRGLAFNFDLTADTTFWQPVISGSTKVWSPASGWGWGGSALNVGSIGYTEIITQQYVSYCNFVYYDGFGTGHPFSGCATYNVNGTDTKLVATALDSSGYTISVDAYYGTYELVSADGNHIFPQNSVPLNSAIAPGSVVDRNGNEVTGSTIGTSTTYEDTLGTTALTITGGNPSPYVLAYTSPAGTAASVTASFKTYTVKTNFACSGVSEFGPTSISMVDRISLPDGTFYQFSYEGTPGFSGDITGRLASVILPTLGTISYKYTGSNNGIMCADGSAAGLTRSTPDGTWTYTRSSLGGGATGTTATDPMGNVTALQFQGVYETARSVYQGTLSGTLLKLTTTCYNGTISNCTSTPVTPPIMQRTIIDLLSSSPLFGLESRKDTFYNSYGWLTETDEYAYGTNAPGPIVRKTVNTYANLGNGIANKPYTVKVEDGSGTVKSTTTYGYDAGTIISTSSPQHVAIVGSRGNLTSVANLVQGTQALTKTYTYFDTGNIASETDVNLAQTGYTYGACGNSFPTNISEPLGLSQSLAWNCTGGVETQDTDENGFANIYNYNQDRYFWRMDSKYDRGFNLTTFGYGSTSRESSLLFNAGSSVVDTVSVVDSLGRPHIYQTRQAPNSATFDSVETDYDSAGRIDRVTLPYAGSEFQTNSGAPSTTTKYDPLGRTVSVTDGGGGVVSFIYSQNYVTQISSPAPSGENAKVTVRAFDSLGRLSSVCEVTQGVGSGACPGGSTGYLTNYTYDVLNNLTSITQNAQSTNMQIRTYMFDGAGRLISEVNPETGSIQSFYDTDPGTIGTKCPGSYVGDLIKTVDALLNTTCYTYDLLHRMTSAIYSGAYGPTTPSKYIVYDSALVNGMAMQNVKRRRAETYTCMSPCSTKITDLGISYTARGEISDLYEQTLHSGGFYRVSQTYWPNGTLATLSNLSGLPTISYGADGEGRIYSATASAGQNPLASTVYDTADHPTQVNLGSLDSESFVYDPNTERMTQYKFSVNGSALVGQLTWNAIGTLKNLTITDPFLSVDNQNCTYSHDDLTRIASVNCGATWAQTFTYDAFGNLSKSGSMSFLPTYSTSTNRMSTIGGSPPSYDANGNVTNDFLHTYAWDAAGRPVTIDGIGATYDGFGRMVEQQRGTVYSQIVYSPTGAKIAVMQGQTLMKGFVPLPAGGAAIYTTGGLDHYRHADWLGSARLGSTPTRTIAFDSAYAPFGEPYAQSGIVDLSFTGSNQDTTQYLYDFPAREYGIQGRWPSPDPAGFIFMHPEDPQTLNRYAYARNNPLGMVDLSGLDGCDPEDPSCGGSGGCDPFIDPFCGGGGPIGNPNPPAAPPPPPPSPAPTTCDVTVASCAGDCTSDGSTCSGNDAGSSVPALGSCPVEGGSCLQSQGWPESPKPKPKKDRPPLYDICGGTSGGGHPSPGHANPECNKCVDDAYEDEKYAELACFISVGDPPIWAVCMIAAIEIADHAVKRCAKEFPPLP
jgi:RHS repeat-associated protein